MLRGCHEIIFKSDVVNNVIFGVSLKWLQEMYGRFLESSAVVGQVCSWHCARLFTSRIRFQTYYIHVLRVGRLLLFQGIDWKLNGDHGWCVEALKHFFGNKRKEQIRHNSRYQF